VPPADADALADARGLPDALADGLASSVANAVGLAWPVPADDDALGLAAPPALLEALGLAAPPDALGDASLPPPHAAKMGRSSASNKKLDNNLRMIRSPSG
jgi:hypothetical protein